jgi:hypothetical protein
MYVQNYLIKVLGVRSSDSWTFHLMVEALSSISWIWLAFCRSSCRCLSLDLRTGPTD